MKRLRFLIYCLAPFFARLAACAHQANQAMAPIVYAGWDEAAATNGGSDYAKAYKEFKPLAEQGDMFAQFNPGVMCEYGQGALQDYAEAMKWYRKAADQGYAPGQLKLGFMYYFGQALPQDYVQAHMWFNLAAAQGDSGAQKLRDLSAKKMTPAQIAEARRLAREWKAGNKR